MNNLIRSSVILLQHVQLIGTTYNKMDKKFMLNLLLKLYLWLHYKHIMINNDVSGIISEWHYNLEHHSSSIIYDSRSVIDDSS